MPAISDIKLFIEICEKSFQKLCIEVQDMEGVEEFETTDNDAWSAQMRELTDQVLALLTLASHFMMSSSRETIYLAAMHAAEYAEESAESYDGLAKKVAEYITAALHYKPAHNIWLNKAVAFWLDPVHENNIVNLAKYKKEHGTDDLIA